MKRVFCARHGPVGDHGPKSQDEHEYGQAYEELRGGTLARSAWYKWESWDEPEMRWLFQAYIPGLPKSDCEKPDWGDEWLDKAERILERSYLEFKAFQLKENEPIPILEVYE